MTVPTPCLEKPNGKKHHLEEKAVWRSVCIPRYKSKNLSRKIIFHFNESFHTNPKIHNTSAHFGDAQSRGSQALGKESSMRRGSEAREKFSVSSMDKSSVVGFGARVPGLSSGCDCERDTCIISLLVFVDEIGVSVFI